MVPFGFGSFILYMQVIFSLFRVLLVFTDFVWVRVSRLENAKFNCKLPICVNKIGTLVFLDFFVLTYKG